MPKTIIPPPGVTAASFGGEPYALKDGKLEVPDAAAAVLVSSHGFRYYDPDAPAPASDDDLITDDDGKPMTGEAFASTMTQPEMKAFLRVHGVAVPTKGTVRDLRALVIETFEREEKVGPVGTNSPEPVKTDET